jgi:protein SCO1/2
MRYRLSLVLALFVLAGLWTEAREGSAKQEMSAPSKGSLSLDEENLKYFTDRTMITHEGRELRFYSDLLKGKVVLINFFYSNCPTAQMSLITMFKLQKMLGNQLGADMYLLSISVDPERDSLKAIQDYAAKFNPQKGWLFLTGTKENMDAINVRLGNRNPNPEFHQQLFLLGNLRTGHWMKLPETARAISVADGLRALLTEK